MPETGFVSISVFAPILKYRYEVAAVLSGTKSKSSQEQDSFQNIPATIAGLYR